MKNERLIEILTEMKTLLKDEDFYLGICNVLYHLLNNDFITNEELIFVNKFILTDNHPTKTNQFKEFIDNPYWINKGDFPSYIGYWWTPIFKAPNTRQNRIDYLTMLISTIK